MIFWDIFPLLLYTTTVLHLHCGGSKTSPRAYNLYCQTIHHHISISIPCLVLLASFGRQYMLISLYDHFSCNIIVSIRSLCNVLTNHVISNIVLFSLGCQTYVLICYIGWQCFINPCCMTCCVVFFLSCFFFS